MTPDNLTLRTLTYSDLPKVMAIERRAFPTAWSLSMFVLELSKPSGICLAALDGNDLVGYLICARYAEAHHLMNVAVDPDRRREGIAKALIDELLERAGVDASITLEVRVSNAGAIALYESYGFRGVGTRRRYYADTGEDAIIMWRAVGTPWETA
ncbi:MAG TPA: ribosomal protein S18-alanine N-acetyltransferase [Solirubrobacteraceae bacterium]|nr:ribosomal protein S18-alanine N-acetyltransferase [Solirubrobacteraceae bacterium]